MREPQRETMSVRDLADRMGRSEASIRAALARKDSWLPPAKKLGGRIVWQRDEVEAFLQTALKPYRVDEAPKQS